ncbi:glycine-rich domain-containing protein [Streptomyces sp. NPDC092296]|uniref:glycine-rich domain-containing protein n=1 Tax=Streptomyces sp. NPDC092296 TaxID=3366012 RepID=UPI00381DAC5D
MHDVRALLTPAAFGGVVATVIDNNPDMEEAAAERIVVEALKFIDAAAQFPTVKITPSHVVDEGWHALILHTNLYENLCKSLGRFVHHWPERPDPERHDEHALTRTVAVIEQAGHTVDRELWVGSAGALVLVAADCSHTPKPGGCGPINPGNCASHCSGGGGDGQ